MLGALVAVRQNDVTGWVLGVVRRLNKLSTDEVGGRRVADRRARRSDVVAREARSQAGHGHRRERLRRIDAGSAHRWPVPSAAVTPDKPLVVKTVIVPTHEYAEGRKMILTTGRSIYTVALRQLVEQRADWSWVAIQIVEKQVRG